MNVLPSKRTVYHIDQDTGNATIAFETHEIEDQDAATEMHVVGVYEGANNGSVTVNTGAPTILVLASYERANWTVNLGPGTTIEKIILSGYENQSVTNADDFAPGTIIEEDLGYVYSAPSSGLTAMEYKLHSLNGNLIDSFNGAYRGSSFTVE